MAQPLPNPLKVARAERGLSRLGLADLWGKPYSRIASLENGFCPQIPAHWRADVDAAGFSFDGLNKSIAEWRAARIAATHGRVAAHG